MGAQSRHWNNFYLSIFGDLEMRKFFVKLRKSEKGATAIEYGLIAALIAVAAIAAMTSVGSSLTAKFTQINSALQ